MRPTFGGAEILRPYPWRASRPSSSGYGQKDQGYWRSGPRDRQLEKRDEGRGGARREADPGAAGCTRGEDASHRGPVSQIPGRFYFVVDTPRYLLT